MIDRARIEEWLELYQVAWQTDDPADVARLFADAGCYYHTAPFRDPLQGRDEIVAWWIGQGESKTSWTFTYEVLAQEGDLFVVRGITRYPEGGSGEGGVPEVYHNLWLVTLAPDGRAREFIEYWMEED